MNFEIVYQENLNSAFPGLPINGQYMQRLDKNRLYFLLGSEKILDIFYFKNKLEQQVNSKKELVALSRKNMDVVFKLSREGEILLHHAHRLNGAYCFSFYADDQDPFKDLNKRVDVQSIKAGLVIEIGKLYHVAF